MSCCLFHHGKIGHSWCGTGNDTRLRKLCTMTVHWSFLILTGACFCVCVNNIRLCTCQYKQQIFPPAGENNMYIHSVFRLAPLSPFPGVSGDRMTATQSEKIKEPFECVFTNGAWFPDSWPLALYINSRHQGRQKMKFSHSFQCWLLIHGNCSQLSLETHLWPCCGGVCGWTVDYNQTLIKKGDFRLHMTLHRQQICSIWPYSECLDWWMDMWCNISNKRRCFRAPKPFFQPVFQDWCTQYSIFIWDSLNIILPTPVYAGCQTANQEVVI